jgi:hypothetical protein
MTELLDEAVRCLRLLPDSVQDCVARTIIAQLDEELEPGSGDSAAIDPS